MLAALTEFIDKDEVYALNTMVEAQIEQSQVRNDLSYEKWRYRFCFSFDRNFSPIIFRMLMLVFVFVLNIDRNHSLHHHRSPHLFPLLE